MFLTQSKKTFVCRFRPLLDNEKIERDDLIEDLGSGRYETVGQGFYKFLRGQKAKSGLQLPQVNQILRRM